MKKLLTFLLLLVPFVANAQLTLEQCQLKAREHYPEVAQYDLIAQSEQYNISNASRSWIPQIVFSGQTTWQSAVASFPDKLKEMLEVQVLPGSKNTVKMGIGVQQNREQEYSKNGNKNTVISINIINQGLHCIINKKQDCDGLKNKITYHYVSRDSQAS